MYTLTQEAPAFAQFLGYPFHSSGQPLYLTAEAFTNFLSPSNLLHRITLLRTCAGFLRELTADEPSWAAKDTILIQPKLPSSLLHTHTIHHHGHIPRKCVQSGMAFLCAALFKASIIIRDTGSPGQCGRRTVPK